MTFEFQCPVCLMVVGVKGPIGVSPKAPHHCGKKARRIYHSPHFSVTWGWADYANKAYTGEEEVPGYTHQEVRKTVDSMAPRKR